MFIGCAHNQLSNELWDFKFQKEELSRDVAFDKMKISTEKITKSPSKSD